MTGQSVKEKIEQLEIPLAEVARRLGISPQTLQKRLNVDDIKVGMLQELATAINKSVYFFFQDGSLMNIQNQVNDNAARYNTQSINKGQQDRKSSNLTLLEQRIKDYDALLKEKDQIISDLRKTIQLYERIINMPA